MISRVFLLSIPALILIGCDAPSKKSGSAPKPEVEFVALPEKVSFNEHIQPILSENCYHCHGPDAKTRLPKKTPLRLDRVEDAFALRSDGRPVIIKGNPEESKLYQLIVSADPDSIMPPPKSHKILKPGEKALLKLWIEQGAEYEAHWSLAPIKKTELPKAGKDWAVNPINHFIAEKLESNKLEPNSPEDRHRFFRRPHLDLTGLPPAPDAVDSFVKSATAARAEHFTRHWLDAARYADTQGIHIDNYPAIWPYRDWVIRAF